MISIDSVMFRYVIDNSWSRNIKKLLKHLVFLTCITFYCVAVQVTDELNGLYGKFIYRVITKYTCTNIKTGRSDKH